MFVETSKGKIVAITKASKYVKLVGSLVEQKKMLNDDGELHACIKINIKGDMLNESSYDCAFKQVTCKRTICCNNIWYSLIKQDVCCNSIRGVDVICHEIIVDELSEQQIKELIPEMLNCEKSKEGNAECYFVG